MAWKECKTCKGTGKQPTTTNGTHAGKCIACKGKGGADTLTTP